MEITVLALLGMCPFDLVITKGGKTGVSSTLSFYTPVKGTFLLWQKKKPPNLQITSNLEAGESFSFPLSVC